MLLILALLGLSITDVAAQPSGMTSVGTQELTHATQVGERLVFPLLRPDSELRTEVWLQVPGEIASTSRTSARLAELGALVERAVSAYASKDVERIAGMFAPEDRERVRQLAREPGELEKNASFYGQVKTSEVLAVMTYSGVDVVFVEHRGDMRSIDRYPVVPCAQGRCFSLKLSRDGHYAFVSRALQVALRDLPRKP